MRRVQKGSVGYDVARWQAFLASQGLLSKGQAIGDFGKNTHAATVTFQQRAGLEDDGIVGPMTRSAAEARGFVAPRGPDDFSSAVLGPNSRERLCTLHPDLADMVVELARRAFEEHGIVSVLPSTGGLRTFGEQDVLCKKVPPPTKVCGGGSYHNYGLAVDIHTLKHGKIDPNDVAEAEKRGPIGKKLGLQWGGDWKDFPDAPHFQLTTGLSTATLLDHYRVGGIIAVAELISDRLESRDAFPPGEEVE